MSTPHNRANVGDIAESILLPGDPLRAKFIAENFLENPVQFNDIRNMLGFTGVYKDKKISVMGTGMGIPSIRIYTHELIQFYGVKNLIRIGTCGAMKGETPLGAVLLGQGCCTDNNTNRRIFPGTYCPVADFELLRTAYLKANAAGKHVEVGNLLSSDSFYALNEDIDDSAWAKFGVMAVEMEGAGLYTEAKWGGARALCMATVSDNLVTNEQMSAEARQTTLTDMIEIALETAWEFTE